MNVKESLVIGKIGRWWGNNIDCRGMHCIVIDKFTHESGYEIVKIVPLELWRKFWGTDASFAWEKITYENIVLQDKDFYSFKTHLMRLLENKQLSNLEYIQTLNYLKEYGYNKTAISR